MESQDILRRRRWTRRGYLGLFYHFRNPPEISQQTILTFRRFHDMIEREVNVRDDKEDLTVAKVKTLIGRDLGVPPLQLDIAQNCRIRESVDTINAKEIIEVIVHPEARNPFMYTSTEPDCLMGETDEPRVITPCGHVFKVDDIYTCCLSQLNDKKSDLHCPYCNVFWPFVEIVQRACLSEDERVFIEERISRNFIEKGKSCPICKSYCERIDPRNQRVECFYCKKKGKQNCDFCWECGLPWNVNHTCTDANNEIQNQLQNCKRITMGYNNMQNVPKIRLCPKCSNMIEHDGGCKTMTCKYCNQIFCFCCLKLAVNGKLPCGNHMAVCMVAPVQNSYNFKS